MGQRLLFVDDEELLRELYSSLDTVLGGDHKIFTAAGARDALKIMRDEPVDIIVSDLAMPEMDGVEFLTEVVRDYPESARIIISGFADRMKVAECLTVGHRFFSKPLNLKTLSGLLKRICQYSPLVADQRVRKIVCGEHALPTPPATYLRLTEVLNSEYSELDDVGRIVEQDPGLSTKLLHIVNSAQFGAGRQIARPSEAVQFLGVEVLRALMLGTQVFSFYKETPFLKATCGDLWNHCLKTAVAARKLAVAERLPTEKCEECFLAGLLHDIGKLILAANSEPEYRRVIEAIDGDRTKLTQAEKAAYGSSHGEVGAYLLALWGIGDTVIRAVQYHNALEESGVEEFGPLLAVHVAQNLEPKAEREHLLDLGALERAGVQDRVDDWRDVLLDLV